MVRSPLSKAQAEYDAITLATDALQSANTALQSRFSPALSRRAGELFSCLTGGRYESVLLDRDFGAQAGETGAAVGARRSTAWSLGTLDQLYLAVRLAICETVLPADDPIPSCWMTRSSALTTTAAAPRSSYYMKRAKHTRSCSSPVSTVKPRTSPGATASRSSVCNPLC